MTFTLINNSPAGFMDLLAKRLEAVLESFWHANDKSNAHEPQVHVMALPLSLAQSVERDTSRDWPIVRLYHEMGAIVGDELETADLTVHIAFGGWNEEPENQGWRIPHNMLWATLQDLLADTRLGAYELVTPVTWQFPDNDQPPFWDASLTTTWHLQQVAAETGKPSADLEYEINFKKEVSDDGI